MITAEPDAGILSVLNVGAGDMKFSFDPNNPQEVARASRVVKDMLARGYMLFVEVGGKLKRVKRFNEKTACYVIADGPDVAPVAEHVDQPEPKPIRRPRRRQRKEREVPAHGHRATSVAPTAGG